MSAITDLPTELLLEITSHFDHSKDTAQACLASTCQQFYGLFMQEVIAYQAKQLQLLLERSMIIPSLYVDSTIEIRKADDGSPERNFFDRPITELAIRVPHMTAIEVRSVRCLICWSKHLRNVELLATELCNLRDLAAIINTCVGKAGLSLRITGSVSQEQSPFIFSFHSNGLPIHVKADVADTSVAVTKQGKGFDFRSFFRRLLRLFPTSTSSTPQQTASEVKESPILSITVTRREPNFRIKFLPQPEFSSLYIDGPIPLHQSLYPITLNALNSPITSLTLHRISFTLYDWAQILPSITMPMLKDLAIGNLFIAFPDLLAFLERHESIENLFLTDNNVIGIAKLPSHSILPRLSTLATTSEYLLPFLQYKNLGYLPALVNIRMSNSRGVSGPSTAQYPYLYNDLHPVYDLISGAQFTKLRVTLDALRPNGLVDWLLYSTPTDRDGKATHHLAGVKTLIINSQDLSVSTELTKELEDWSITADFPGGISQSYDGNQITLLKIIETLIWTKCGQLEMLKLVTDLPTETLLEVASCIGPQDSMALAYLALTCRRLYSIYIQQVLDDQAAQLEQVSFLRKIKTTPSIDHQASNGPKRNLFDRVYNKIEVYVETMTLNETRSVRCLICRAKELQDVELLVTESSSLRNVVEVLGTCIGRTNLRLRVTTIPRKTGIMVRLFQSNITPNQITALTEPISTIHVARSVRVTTSVQISATPPTAQATPPMQSTTHTQVTPPTQAATSTQGTSNFPDTTTAIPMRRIWSFLPPRFRRSRLARTTPSSSSPSLSSTPSSDLSSSTPSFMNASSSSASTSNLSSSLNSTSSSSTPSLSPSIPPNYIPIEIRNNAAGTLIAGYASGTSYSGVQHELAFSISSLPKPQLSSLFIDGRMPFLGIIYPVTLNALNSHITSLSLHRMSIPPDEWARILPTTALPMLRNLTIGGLSIAFRDLVAFLERHESIETLILLENQAIGAANLPTYPILPKLTSLATSSDYILPFLHHKKLGNLPALLRLRIISYTSTGTDYSLHPVYDLLSEDDLGSSSSERDNKALGYLYGVKTLIVNSHDFSISPELSKELKEWTRDVQAVLRNSAFAATGLVHGRSDAWNDSITADLPACGGIRGVGRIGRKDHEWKSREDESNGRDELHFECA
ncbi:hypothetical protein CVT25_015906 [Psilocybe cyanescens]|uniref:F-box domain-containing protein n=1 Tax=Psilocybe cyanescens TaxID=93625 RepID=A0A409WS83_PSICY|nr:hypothetical protein CVT25_015906 [Psilocybe cyanescens]